MKIARQGKAASLGPYPGRYSPIIITYTYTCIRLIESRFFTTHTILLFRSNTGLEHIKKTSRESQVWPFYNYGFIHS